MIGMVPLPRGVWRIFAELEPNDPVAKAGHGAATGLHGASPVSDRVLDRIRSLMRERVGDAAPRIASGTWTSVFHSHRRIASAYRRQRMFLAGDAAHIHSALGGQGMNTGIGDAFNLGWKLSCVISGKASDRLLDTYEVARRPVAADVVRQTSRAWNILIGHTVFSRLFCMCCCPSCARRQCSAGGSRPGRSCASAIAEDRWPRRHSSTGYGASFAMRRYPAIGRLARRVAKSRVVRQPRWAA